MSVKATPPPTLVFNVDGFSWDFGEPLFGVLGRAVPLLRKMFSLDTSASTRDDGSRVRNAHVADDELVPWRERRVQAVTRVHGAARADFDKERPPMYSSADRRLRQGGRCTALVCVQRRGPSLSRALLKVT